MALHGKALDIQSIELVNTVYSYFKLKTEDPDSTEYKNDMKLIPTVAEATGLPQATIMKIVKTKSSNSNLYDEAQPSNFTQGLKLNLDSLVISKIIRLTSQFYVHYQKLPSLDNIKNTLAAEDILENTNIIYNHHLEQLLTQMGFKIVYYNNTNKVKRKLLMEDDILVSARSTYLQAIKQVRDSGKPIIYIGETIVSSCQKAKSKKTNTFSKFIVVHAGNGDGFLNGASTILQSKYSDHNEVHYNDFHFEHFQLWMKNKLLPNLPQKGTVIVMNNKCYNSNGGKPNSNWYRRDIDSWLRKNSISFLDNLPKTEILTLAENHQLFYEEILNDMVKESGHEVLRIPALHADLNAIEWFYEYFKKEFWKTDHLKRPLNLKYLDETLGNRFEGKWKQVIAKVMEIEQEYFDHDTKLGEIVPDMFAKIKKGDFNSDDDSE